MGSIFTTGRRKKIRPRTITLSLVKLFRTNRSTQISSCGGAQSCEELIDTRHCRFCKWGIKFFSKSFVAVVRQSAYRNAIGSSIIEGSSNN